jgi:D-serine deaminase-like pyridoxal phosphate-dependent protein
VLVDCEDILPFLDRYHELSGGHRLGVYSKLETGTNRAGLSYDSEELKTLLTAIHHKETADPSKIRLLGFYSHLGTSYNADSTNEALDYLADELERCAAPTEWTSKLYNDGRRLTVTVGATPTATSTQNLITPETADPSVKRVRELMARLKENLNVEIHAGAYVFLDMQLMAAHARPAEKHRDFKDIAFTLVAEIASLYPHRSKPEALMACGNLSLAREKCRTYKGFGVVTPWDPAHRGTSEEWSFYDPQKDRTGWIASRISQEHGILTWEGPVDQKRPLKVGQKGRLWTNHCCIAAAGYHYFMIVDSDKEGAEKDRSVDVWHSWRGW